MATLLIVTSTGPADPDRASIAFQIAVKGAAASGVRCGIVIAGDATLVLKPEVAAEVRGLGVAPLAELLQGCLEHDIPLYVCRGCAEARGVTSSHLEGRDAVFVGPSEVVELTTEFDRVLSF